MEILPIKITFGLDEFGLITMKVVNPSMVSRMIKRRIELGLGYAVQVYPTDTITRSQAQNAWYWGVAIPTIQEFEAEREGKKPQKNSIHLYNKIHVLEDKPVIQIVQGREVVSFEGKSTADLTKKEFCTFVDMLVQHWGEKGLEIPLPKDRTYNTLHDILDL